MALLGAQTVRTFFAGFLPLREVVPLVVTTSFVWIATKIRAHLDSLDAAPIRYGRSSLTVQQGTDMLARLERCMAEGMYRDPDASLKSIADSLGVSPHQLSQAVNQLGDTSLTDYLTSWRLEHAKRELLDPANDCFTIEAIATRSGFASRSAFYRAFREAEGIAPVAFRTTMRATLDKKSRV
jgi:AraC-like DNA-binding protein